MKILYIENIRLPTEKAHGIQIMKMCEAFANSGHQVVLLVPNRKNNIQEDPFRYYGVKDNFEIKRLRVPNILWLGSLGFWIQSMFFAEVSAWYMWKFMPDILYSREERILLNFIFIHKNIYWESHRGSWNIAAKIVSKFANKIIVITQGLKDFYVKKTPKLSSKIVIAPDGVDLELFDISLSKEECRKKLSLPLDKKIIIYNGHLYKWKGAHVLAEAAKKLGGNELVVFVGGTTYDLEKFKKEFGDNKNILILGQRPYLEIPLYLKAADVGVLPNSAKEDIGNLYTSPLKLFEFMASGVPIVASNVPAISEVLNTSNSFVFNSDDSDDLVKKLLEVLDNFEEAQKRADKAKSDVKKFSWTERVKLII